MKIYFYHTQDIQRICREFREGTFPGHFLYGALYFDRHGIDVVWHRHCPLYTRWKIMVVNTWRILTCRDRYDIFYATSFRGIEPIIFLRALGLFPHPVFLWHHQPIVKAKNPLREMVAKLFYRGIDRMFFFSEAIIKESLKSVKADPSRMRMIHWGADLDFYDRLMRENSDVVHRGFISTGKERRDIPTLIKAFNNTGEPLRVFLDNSCEDDYYVIVPNAKPCENIKVLFPKKLIPGELAQEVWKAACVVICCKETNYTVGLTTLVEAMALGLPLICSNNPQFAFNIEDEGIGIAVDYYDREGWEKAIRYIATHPEEAAEMGRKGRMLAERLYNAQVCTDELAHELLSWEKERHAYNG